MADQARIHSIETLGAFRANLIVFLSRAREALDAVSDEVGRVKQWVDTDQRLHWEGQLRRRSRQLDLAEQELFSARLSGLRDSTAMQELQVARAKKAVAEAEEKLKNIKRWSREFDQRVGPHYKKTESLRHYLETDLVHALAFLVNAQRTLESYSESIPPVTTAAPAPQENPPT